MSQCKSEVWQHFTNDERMKIATCKICEKTINSSYGTSSLKKHLNKIHNIEIVTKNSSNILPSIGQGSSKASIAELISKCAVQDGMSFKRICHSEAAKCFLQSYGFEMPNSPTTVRSYVMDFAKLQKENIKRTISNSIEKNKKYSFSIDEWTDISLRRYLNITLLGNESVKYELGLAPITGRATAGNILDIANEKLEEFGISVEKHVVGSIQDGANVMKRFSKDHGAEYQLCYAHAIHLAVTDFFYKKNVLPHQADSSSESDFSIDEDDTIIPLNDSIMPSIEYMRKIIKSFRKSPYKSSILEKHSEEQFGRPLKLISDVKTRWNSLVFSIERFVNLRDSINKTQKEMGADEISVHHLEKLQETLSFLKPLEMALTQLCEDDSNIGKAEGVLIYLFDYYENQPIHGPFFGNLKQRLIDRRKKELVSALLFLQTGKYFSFIFQISDNF